MATVMLGCGTAGADSFQVQPQKFVADVQSEALGESILAQPNSPAALLTNPAATAVIYQPKVSLMDVSFPQSVKYRFAAITLPSKYGNFSGAMSVLNYGDINNTPVGGKMVSLDNSGDLAAVLNYSLTIKRELPYPQEYGTAGISVKYLRSTLGDYLNDTVAVDIGGRYNIPFVKDLSAGIVYRNAGGSMKFAGGSNTLISEVETGLRYDMPSLGDLHALVDGGRDVTDGLYTVSAGLEVSPFDPLTLRAGWRDTGQSLGSGFRGGLGFDFGSFSLNYAVLPYSREQGTVQQVGLDIAFGGIADERKAYDHYLKYHFAIARDRYERRDYIAARRELEDILSVYPDDQQAKEYLEKIGMALDDIEQAKTIEANRWLRRATVAMSEKDYIRARKSYNYVLKIDPANTAALEGQAKLDKMVEGARKLNGRKENYEKIMAMFNEALGLYQRGDYVVAKEKFQELLTLDPDNQQAIKYVQDIDTQMAKVTALQINNLFVKGMAFYNKGDYSEAMKYFGAVTIASPDRLDAQDYLAKCQNIIKQEEDKVSSAEAEQQREKIKEEVESSFAQAKKLFDDGNYDEAIKAFARSREVAARYDNAKLVEESKNYIVQTRNAISEKHFKIGFDYAQKNRVESAAYEYRKALEYNPDNTSAKVELDSISEKFAQEYYEQGMSYFSKGNADKAKELFKKSLYYKSDKIESLRALERIK
jgi:tetratricopeptide (TPR) repeat protein